MVYDRVGQILSYRLGRKTQYPKQCLMRVTGIGQSEAGKMVGLKVGWPADEPRIYGKIVGMHGRNGVLRVRFKKGLPGQALGDIVKVIE